MRSFPFFKYSPSGNMTLLIEDVGIPGAERAAIARNTMRCDHAGAEQVGYIDLLASPPRLEMMGGELCLNACRAMAALLQAMGRLSASARPDGCVAEPGWEYGLLASSGVEGTLPVRARALDDAAFPARHEAGVCLTLPAPADITSLAEEIYRVRLPGIVHLVLDAAQHAFPADWRAASAELRQRFALDREEAVGCLWLDAAVPSLTPVVWVRDTDETQLETACGSGTLACALFLTDRHPDFGLARTLRLQQYGGAMLEVSLDRAGSQLKAWINGTVDCIARGELFVDDAER